MTVLTQVPNNENIIRAHKMQKKQFSAKTQLDLFLTNHRRGHVKAKVAVASLKGTRLYE